MFQKPLTVRSCNRASHQSMQTILENSLSASFRVTDPFWQGDILSPSLFSLCMDDLSKRFKGWVYPGSKSGRPAALRHCLRPNVILLFDGVLWSCTARKGVARYSRKTVLPLQHGAADHQLSTMQLHRLLQSQVKCTARLNNCKKHY